MHSNHDTARRRPGPTVRVQVQEHAQGSDPRRREDRLATEEPLEVRCAWPGSPPTPVAVTMRTPGHDFELATGLLVAEGVARPGQVDGVSYCDGVGPDPRQAYNVVSVRLTEPPVEPLRRRKGTVTAASSACGVCGAESIDAVLGTLRGAGRSGPVVGASVQVAPIPAEVVHGLPAQLRQAQQLFDRTGGLHAAGLFTEAGQPMVVREDIGRHNAVDKVVGHRVLAGQAPGLPLLAVSGRLGYEIAQKAAVAGVAVVVAVGAPSSLAVDLARQTGTTLVGFAGSHRFVTYTHPERIGV